MLPPSSQPAGASQPQPARGVGSEASRAGAAAAGEARPARPRVTPGVEQPPQQYELRSGAARLLVRTDGTLVLLREEAVTATGRAVVPWFVARQGARATVTNAAAASGRLEMRWGDNAVLRITATSHPEKPALSWDQARAPHALSRAPHAPLQHSLAQQLAISARGPPAAALRARALFATYAARRR